MDPTERFTDRVDDYVRYRPSYPRALLDFFRDRLGLEPAQAVADLGSGTGILSRLFLDAGNRVYGVEPNRAMAAAAERALGDDTRFESVAGRSEATTLPDRCVDWVVAGQAFHWFDVEATRREVRRILRPGGGVGLIWNIRRPELPLMQDYDRFLRRFGRDYVAVSSGKEEPDALARFFAPLGYEQATFANEQMLDRSGLRGRVLSASYIPRPGEPEHEPMLAALDELFDAHEEAGCVRFAYRTNLYHRVPFVS